MIPDGFAGALMAAEGFSDVRALLHGPGGCRFRYMRLSRELYSREDERGEKFLEDAFRGNPRLPCTFLDENDYIYGGYDELVEALRQISSKDDSVIVVVTSPAAALIGDNVRKAIRSGGLESRAFTVDFNPVSLSMEAGSDMMTREIVRFASPEQRKTADGTVNLLGVPILCRDWRGTVEEASRLLGMMGLKVTASIGCGSSMQDVRDSGSAEFNVSVFPEFSEGTARLYRDELGIPTNDCEIAPVGLDATREWILSVSDLTGRDPSAVLDEIDESKRFIRKVLLSDERRASEVARSHFSIDSIGSVKKPLDDWLSDYLSMIPSARCQCSGEYEFDYVFGPGDVTKMQEIAGRCHKGIDVGFPPRRKFLFNNHTVVGIKGALNLLEEIFG